jgi:hypothetical protein
MPDAALREAAQGAAKELGQALAAAGWRIVVYSAGVEFLEPFVVTGFLRQRPTAGDKSVEVHAPHDSRERFAEESDDNQRAYFQRRSAPDQEWESSFYRSLSSADAVLLLGGGYSTLVAGLICLGREIPVIPVAAFGGSALKVWQHVARDAELNQLAGADALAAWTGSTATNCVASLEAWHNKRKLARNSSEQRVHELEVKSRQLDALAEVRSKRITNTIIAICTFALFVALLIGGLRVTATEGLLTTTLVLGLVAAGASGSTIRLLLPDTPESSPLVAIVLGSAAGLVLSLLYLLPQFVGEAAPPAAGQVANASIRYQFIAALVFSFISGVGFDIVADKFKKRAVDQVDQVLQRQG